MKLSQNGIEFMKSKEGLRLAAYDDGYGNLTIGYGHTNYAPSAGQYPVYRGQQISAAEAETIFRADVEPFENTVNSLVKQAINQNQFDALVSLTYNIGGGAFGTSNVLMYVNQGNFQAAAQAFKVYIHSGGVVSQGLVNRRNAEVNLFLSNLPTSPTVTTTSNESNAMFDAMIQWMDSRRGKVGYTLNPTLRLGPNNYDCSSAVYYALISAGFFPQMHPGNTDSLFSDLRRHSWVEVPDNNGFIPAKRGDVFIWGVEGKSSGEYGHTGIFVDNADTIIHCNYSDQTIAVSNHDQRWIAAGRPYVTVFRYTGSGGVSQTTTLGYSSNTQGRTPMAGVFVPNRTLEVSGDTSPTSPALATYNAGESIIYDSYTFENGYAWISYIASSGNRRYIAVGPDDGNANTVWGRGFFDNATVSSGGSSTGMIPLNSVFVPNRTLEVSGDTDPSSPALATYDAGQAIVYDSYVFENGYAWISYIAGSGLRRYVAVGPDDGNPNTVWGTGFFTGGNMSAAGTLFNHLGGVFVPNRTLEVSADTSPTSPALATYDAGESIGYDSYVFENGYAWISYIASSGNRRYIAVGPDDGNVNTVWGTGFFDQASSVYTSSTASSGLISYQGVFTTNRVLEISADTNPSSPAVGTYANGETIYYDSYTFKNGYAWISYIAGSGYRRYIAVGPDDGNTNTVWGRGFFDGASTGSGTSQGGNITSSKLTFMSGVFIPDRTLEVSGDTSPTSPALATYDAGERIPYDSYIFENGYAWISYIAGSGNRRYIAVGPNDGNANTVWGRGFFDASSSSGTNYVRNVSPLTRTVARRKCESILNKIGWLDDLAGVTIEINSSTKVINTLTADFYITMNTSWTSDNDKKFTVKVTNGKISVRTELDKAIEEVKTFKGRIQAMNYEDSYKFLAKIAPAVGEGNISVGVSQRNGLVGTKIKIQAVDSSTQIDVNVELVIEIYPKPVVSTPGITTTSVDWEKVGKNVQRGVIIVAAFAAVVAIAYMVSLPTAVATAAAAIVSVFSGIFS